MTDESLRAFGRSARERRAHAKHFYPGTETLINHAGLTNTDALKLFERQSVAAACLDRLPMAAFTYDEFKAVHRHLFRDVYPWAGKARDYTTGRTEAPFCLPEFIDAEMKRIFDSLHSSNDLTGLSADEFAARAATLINDINAVHPFIEGNGRVSREFLKDLAAHANHPLDLSRFTRQTWYPAAAVGFTHADNAPMTACIRMALFER